MRKEFLPALDRHFEKMRRRILIAVCFSLVGIVGIFDHVTGYETSFSILCAGSAENEILPCRF
jgi:hypothetical protein